MGHLYYLLSGIGTQEDFYMGFCNRGRGWKKIALDTGSSGNQGIHGKKHIFMQKGIHGKKECTYLMI